MKCEKPVELQDGRTLSCFLPKGHTTPEECLTIEFGDVTRHNGGCEDRECRGCFSEDPKAP